jgi:hypothetical protein
VNEGTYTDLIEEYGLTAEKCTLFDIVGQPRESIAQLRTMFQSLDADDGGDLSVVELYVPAWPRPRLSGRVMRLFAARKCRS